MRSFLLDTNICIYALKGNRNVLGRLLATPPTSVWVSVITEAELRVGAAKSESPRKTLRKLESFLEPLQPLSFTSDDAAVYAQVRSRLESTGKPIGPLDTLIAAHAVSHHLTLVTNSEREFSRVAGLRWETWARTSETA